MDQWHGQYSAEAKASGAVATFWELISFGQQIGDVDRSPVEDGTCRGKPTRQGQRSGCGDRPMMADDAKHLTVHLTDQGIIGIAKAGGTRRDFCEDALQIRRRARYYPQDLCSCALLVTGLGQLAPGLGEFLSELLVPAFRRGKIVGGRSCHDYTRLPYNLPVRVRAASWRRLASQAVGNATRYGGSMECPDPGEYRMSDRFRGHPRARALKQIGESKPSSGDGQYTHPLLT